MVRRSNQKSHRLTETNHEDTPHTAPDLVACFLDRTRNAVYYGGYGEKCRNFCQDLRHEPVSVTRSSSPHVEALQLGIHIDRRGIALSVFILLLLAMLTLDQYTLGQQTALLSQLWSGSSSRVQASCYLHTTGWDEALVH
jgi:hypothetical protein